MVGENKIVNGDIYCFSNGEIEINGVRYIPESVLMSGKYKPKTEAAGVLDVDVALVKACGAILAGYMGVVAAGNVMNIPVYKDSHYSLNSLVEKAAKYLEQYLVEYKEEP